MKHARAAALLAFSAPLLAAAVSAAPSVYPTGVTRYDPQKAFNQYVIFSGADNRTHLIDMNGNEVKRWDRPGFPSAILEPKLAGGERGHVLLQTADLAEPGKLSSAGNGLRNQAVGELDWAGKTVWQWGDQAPGGAARQHHDLRRLANGNTLVLANRVHAVKGFQVPEVIDDVIYEVTPQGQVAWRWTASEHLHEFGFGAEQLKLVLATKNPDYLHINNLAPLGANRWHAAGDKRFAPDNLLFDSRNANFIAIIDKASGKVVWRLGPNLPPIDPRNAQKLPRPVDQISGQHDAHIIPEGLPGAGNLLVFDNQGDAGYPSVQRGVISGSRVLEIDPVKKQIVWQYTAESSKQPGWAFFSSFISSARRLPNGNTLIDEGQNGRFFQVTPGGEIVWEYVSPYFGKAPLGDAVSNWVYRALPVDYSWVPEGTPREEKAVQAAVPGAQPVTAAR
ncbi:Arylsulfotransferase (ASST) [Pseudomonas citronellolis]|uniref:Arylsulfotransferase (ASST) n=1 Tax=Pseudomonas citronellolis TaxID=53408 RepID=A0AAQ1HL86_9PSED|nr:aryl-sulfate sulfotransferase [Pseudomonas citronellolis]TGC25711.1 ArsR family transcriptional regulator [Pseudomonas citronellolis]SFC55875.1 Arylsulfotransferase (ASST) [Pseudomonas citronellolis]